VSLFSGGMGLDIGMHKTNRFRLLACVEIEPVFALTIETNSKMGFFGTPVKVVNRDISKLSVHEFLEETGIDPSDVDIVVGGPPCQTFSTAGRRKSVADHRGTLLWDYLRFVEGLKPKVFLMENVRGLLSSALKHRPISERPKRGGQPLEPEEMPGSVLNAFVEDLRKVDGGVYQMDCFEVNAVNYGAPQLRERALFIGNRFGHTIDFPLPTHGPDIQENSDLFSSNDLTPWKTLADAVDGLVDPKPEVMDFSPRKKSFLSLVPEGSNWRSLPEDIQKESMKKAFFAKGGRSGWWRRLSFDLPTPTLVTMPNHASTSLCHPTETRALSVKEYARIQEFPDSWIFEGKLSQRYVQIGNAVPVRLGEVAGEVIAEALDSIEKKGSIETGPASTFRRVYLQAHVRRRQWYKNGQTIVRGIDKNSDYAKAKTVKKTGALSNG